MLRKPRFLLALAYLVVFFVLLSRSLTLEFNGDLIALLPEDNPHLETYQALSNLRYSEGGFDAILVAPDADDLLALGYEVAERISNLRAPDGTALFQRVELENDLYTLRPALAYLMLDHELDTLYAQTDRFIQREIERMNPFFVDFEEDEEDTPEYFSSTDDLHQIIGGRSVLLEEMLQSGRFEVDNDSTQILLRVLPDFARSDFDKVSIAWEALQRESKVIEASFSPGTVALHWGGSYLRHYHKINDVQRAVLTALVIGIGSLIVFLIWYMYNLNRRFRMPWPYLIRDLAVMFFVLFTGFGIVLGLASFVFAEINIFTGIIFSILFGINLDYILHVYAIERQWGGIDKVKFRDYFSGARPILISAATTGVAILSLVFSDIDGFVQFGSIFFASILVNLGATFLLIPLLCPMQSTATNLSKVASDDDFIGVTSNSTKSANLNTPANPNLETHQNVSKDDEIPKSSFTPQHPPDFAETAAIEVRTGLNLARFWTNIPAKQSTSILVAFITIIAITAVFGLKTLRFTFDFASLEPAGVVTDFDRKVGNFPAGPSYFEPSYFITNNTAETKELFDKISNNPEKYLDIDRVESLSARFPHTAQNLEARQERISRLQALMTRHESLLRGQSEELHSLTDLIFDAAPPTFENLPHYIQNRFFLRDGSMAPMVIVYPAMSLSDGQRSIRFRQSSGAVSIESGTFYAASTSIIASSILEMLIDASRFLILMPLATIMLMLLITQKSFTKALLVLTPVLFSGLLLIAANLFAQMEINLYNVIVFPILIGVGADNGIHLVDSWNRYQDRFLEIFLSVRLPILAACSISTVLGFTGLLFINHPGIVSIGILAVAGVIANLFATFVMALVLHRFRGSAQMLKSNN
jgi:hypothetical protein